MTLCLPAQCTVTSRAARVNEARNLVLNTANCLEGACPSAVPASIKCPYAVFASGCSCCRAAFGPLPLRSASRCLPRALDAPRFVCTRVRIPLTCCLCSCAVAPFAGECYAIVCAIGDETFVGRCVFFVVPPGLGLRGVCCCMLRVLLVAVAVAGVACLFTTHAMPCCPNPLDFSALTAADSLCSPVDVVQHCQAGDVHGAAADHAAARNQPLWCAVDAFAARICCRVRLV